MQADLAILEGLLQYRLQDLPDLAAIWLLLLLLPPPPLPWQQDHLEGQVVHVEVEAVFLVHTLYQVAGATMAPEA